MKNAILTITFYALSSLAGAEYHTPAGLRPAARTEEGHGTVLPGGRLLSPFGRQFSTGPGPFGIAVSPAGNRVVSANGGPDRYSLTVLERSASAWQVHHFRATSKKDREPGDADDWASTFMGLAFDGESVLYASEGESGQVRILDPSNGASLGRLNLNGGDYTDSYSGDLALDRERGILYVLDQANFRLTLLDTRARRRLASIRVGRLPFAVTLSPDGRRAYVTNLGMFAYQPVPRADPKRPRETGLRFPPFGFPSAEARNGVEREAVDGKVRVPGLGDPNAPESNSLAVIDVADARAPKLVSFVRTGLAFGPRSHGGSSPSGVLATADRIYVTNGTNDSITVVDAATLKVTDEILLRIPGLERLRGILPIGLAYHPASRRLLVAEAGINAVGVIDERSMKLTGHIPAGWFPTRIAVHGDEIYVTNAKGHGIGPNATLEGPLPRSFQGERRRGSISSYSIPTPDQLAELTPAVLRNNGFAASAEPATLPPALRHIVIIVKENRTFDEVFGDAAGAPALARFGRKVTPNHHAIAERWAMSDNFYADSEVSVDGHHWLVGAYPNAWTESTLMAAYGGQKQFRFSPEAPGRLEFPGSNSSVHPEEQPEAGSLWHHLERGGIPFRNFGEGFELAGIDEGEGLKPSGARFFTNIPIPDPLYRNTSRQYPGFNTNIPDQYRATQFIGEIDRLYRQTGKPLPRLLFIHLPNDHGAKPRPKDGYPTAASYVADNDYALGRILEYLSHTPWWRSMAVFVTEDDAQGGVDHIDAHRTVLLMAGPHVKKSCVVHNNSSFTGMLKTVFEALRLPPLNLYDATARDLGECFTAQPDFAPFTALQPSLDVFDPAKAREPLDPTPAPKMDDPRELQRQHRR